MCVDKRGYVCFFVCVNTFSVFGTKKFFIFLTEIMGFGDKCCGGCDND